MGPTPESTRPVPARSPARRLSDAVARFLRIEAASGVLLLIATAFALVWANSPWSATYQRLWQEPLTFAVNKAAPTYTLLFGVNEGLMTVFFLVAGLEIRRELHEGRLSSPRFIALPLLAALGGVIVPALIFLAVDHGPELRRGWAVPTATDIAFAVGALALLGARVPRPLRALLLALAIIDDIAAVIIIACFYSDGLKLAGLVVTALAGAVLLGLERLGVRSILLYAAVGILLWLGLLQGGVHPMLAGVILAFLIPTGAAQGAPPQATSPGARLAKTLHPWAAYGIIPIFALANAGIAFRGVGLRASAAQMLLIGVAAALALGKPLGIVLGTLTCVRLRIGALPEEVTVGGILLIGCLGGIGFTLSIFIAALAFADESLLPAAKLGILVGSASAAVVGVAVGRRILRAR